MKTNKKGFTLIELLVVIIIIATLAVTVYVALDPAKRLRDARNARRRADVESILTAIHQYIVDNGGSLPTGIATTEKQLGTCTTEGNTPCTNAAAACLDLSTTLAKYLKSIPKDPSVPSSVTDKTYYSVVADSNNIITVKACNAEGGETIQVSR